MVVGAHRRGAAPAWAGVPEVARAGADQSSPSNSHCDIPPARVDHCFTDHDDDRSADHDPPSVAIRRQTTLPATTPYCTYTPAPDLESTLGIGGATPGEWYDEECFNKGYVNPMPAVWIPDPTPTTPPSPPPAVPAVASQALGNAGLVSPTIVLNPVGPQVTNFQSWLAISPADWHPVTATADDGGVDVTVTASPTAVDWNLGNGTSLSCAGPGVLYDPSKPDNEQSTYCSYTWPAPSYDQPGGTYDVTATIEYQVTTSVTGAANTTPDLGTHFGPTAHDAVQVTEVEALGTSG